MTQFGRSTAAPLRSRRRFAGSDRSAASDRAFLGGYGFPRPVPLCPLELGFELRYFPEDPLPVLRLLSFAISGTSASAAKPTGWGTHRLSRRGMR